MTKVSKLWMAVQHTRRARNLLRECGCGPAADTMARALKSVEGAHRHAGLVETRLAIVAAAAPAILAAESTACPVLTPDYGVFPFEETR